MDFQSLEPRSSYPRISVTKLNELETTQSGIETAPLNGTKNCSDGGWDSVNNLKSTTDYPYMIVKTAKGDFNHDGFENEVAVLTADVKQKVKLHRITGAELLTGDGDGDTELAAIFWETRYLQLVLI